MSELASLLPQDYFIGATSIKTFKVYYRKPFPKEIQNELIQIVKSRNKWKMRQKEICLEIRALPGGIDYIKAAERFDISRRAP